MHFMAKLFWVRRPILLGAIGTRWNFSMGDFASIARGKLTPVTLIVVTVEIVYILNIKLSQLTC